MANNRPKFNPQAVQKNNQKKGKQNKKRKKDEDSSSFFYAQEKEQPNTRAIRFAPRTAMNVFSGLFFFLFLVMCVVVLLNFGRVDTLARLAMSKQVNKTELIENINTGLTETEQMKYDGEILTEKLFTFQQKDLDINSWKEEITPYLAVGLSPEDLGFSNSRIDRTAKEVKFIKLVTTDEKERFYRLYYDVRFTEGSSWKQTQIILPVCYRYSELKLISRPQFTNTVSSESKNDVAFNEKRFLPTGEDVDKSETDKLQQFVKRFFELYVSNDEKLQLVSKVQGLEGAKLKSVDTRTMVVDKNGNYHVLGTFSFFYQEESPFTSGFDLVIKPTKESYFVTKMNQE